VEEAERREKEPIQLPVFNDKVKVNFGCFRDMFYYGWNNVDILDLRQFASQTGRRFTQLDVRHPLPYQDNSVDYITAHHLLEHLTYMEGKQFMKECLRILKPGGVMRVSVPNLTLLSERYLENNTGYWRDVSVEVEKAGSECEAYFNLAMSGHLSGYDEENLLELFYKTGFESYVSRFDSSKHDIIRLETIDSFPTLSAYVEGVKPLRDTNLTEAESNVTRNVTGVTESVTKDSQNMKMLEYLQQ
jgi:predicted SAM-dependent methyltransferase